MATAPAKTPEHAEYRLDAALETFILEQCEPQHLRHARIHLDLGSQSSLDSFVAALDGRMEVRDDVLPSDPQEICILASGTTADGGVWRDMPVILLAPSWARDAESSEHLADVIVTHWERLAEIQAVLRGRRAPSPPLSDPSRQSAQS